MLNSSQLHAISYKSTSSVSFFVVVVLFRAREGDVYEVMNYTKQNNKQKAQTV